VFVSSHILSEVELMCDRVAIIHRGTILETTAVKGDGALAAEMDLRVDDFARAAAVLDELGLEYETQENRICVKLDEESTPAVVARLTAEGIGIYHAQRRLRTLEERFMLATGGETV